MRLRVAGRTFRGPAVDLRPTPFSPAPGDVLDAVEHAGAGADVDPVTRANNGTGVGVGIAVDCPPASRFHRRLALVSSSPPRSLRALLAAAARSLGWESDHRHRIDRLRADLEALDRPATDTSAARRRVAERDSDVARLRERVAELRGRLQARRETGAPTADTEASLADAVRELSAVETERVAAEQSLDRAERRARRGRDRGEERLRLEDALATARREARAELSRRVYDRFAAAVEQLPSPQSADSVPRPGRAPGDYDGDPASARLAAVAVASLSAPVVLAPTVDRFESAERAADALGAPVVRL